MFISYRFEEYRTTKSIPSDPQQPLMTAFSTAKSTQYNAAHPQQKAITNSILADLVIGCNMPLSIVENRFFRHFLSVVDGKYYPVCRRTLTSKVDSIAEDKSMWLKTNLSKTDHVSVTVDIWSDRKMRGFLGVTVHYVERQEQRIQLRSNLLSCDRFKGPHTAERICELFESICKDYNIKQKLDFILSDNAANMKKAFTVCFPSENEDTDEDIDEPELWNDLSLEDMENVDAAINKHDCSVLLTRSNLWWGMD